MDQRRLLLVEISQSCSHIMQHFPGFVFRDVLSFCDILECRTVLDIRHDKIRHALITVVMRRTEQVSVIHVEHH